MISRLPDGRWRVDVEPVKGRRHRKIFKAKAEAVRFEALVRSRYAVSGSFAPVVADNRSLAELVERWYLLHGSGLTVGASVRRKLLAAASLLPLVPARSLTGADFTSVRGDLLASGRSGKTLNNLLGYLRSCFNELHRLGEITFTDPFASVRKLKLHQFELSYLSAADIKVLFRSIDRTCRLPHVRLISLVCLSTGCRWGEAESLVPGRVRGGQVHFINTKSKRSRSVPVSPDLEADLLRHFSEHGLFSHCLNGFYKSLKRSGIKLPAGQSSHVLRHTFASHFIMNGGNILVLQRLLGHSSLSMTMRYAHLAPGHLQEAVKLNPLASFDLYSTL